MFGVSLKKIALLIVASIVATLLAAVMAGMAGGACHCSTPVAIFFPFAVIGRGSDTAETIATVGQYPLYVFVLGFVRGELARIAAAAILIGLHAAAGYVAMTYFQH